MADVPALSALIAASVRQLSIGFYTAAQVDAALRAVFGVDSQLVADGTYYIIDGDSGPAAAGGWSGRGTLYGGDQAKDARDPRLDPATDPARIRAFFVHPAYARRGLARQLYRECERAALATGFRRFELMATLPGEPLYAALGFRVVEPVVLSLEGVDVPFKRMMRGIGGPLIRRSTEADFPAMLAIVNDAAEAYRGVIPADRWHDPYMSADELAREIGGGVVFWVAEDDGRVTGVMGIQD
jgi:GNAT superfamily N-acetyltransferase